VRRIPVFFVALLTLVGLARSEVSVSSHLNQIPDYRAALEREVSSIEGRSQVGSFNAELLNEFVLKSYSRWNLTPVPTEAGDAVGSPVTLEVYEMLDSPAAFGLFSLWEKAEDRRLEARLNLPIEHRYSGADLIFWRSNYFLRLQTPAPPADPEPLERLVRSMLDAIPSRNVLPVGVAQLPREELEEGSVELYLGRSGLAYAPDFPEPLVPLMGLEDQIEIVSARYRPASTPVFLITYPTPALAQTYSTRIQAALSSYFGEPPIFLKRSGPIIALCLGSEQDAERLLGRVNYLAQVKWLEDKPPESEVGTFLGMVSRAILGTLAFLLITLGIGVAVGYARYLVIRRYPSVGRRDEMIRLKIDERG
jgi:hypothetical protein